MRLWCPAEHRERYIRYLLDHYADRHQDARTDRTVAEWIAPQLESSWTYRAQIFESGSFDQLFPLLSATRLVGVGGSIAQTAADAVWQPPMVWRPAGSQGFPWNLGHLSPQLAHSWLTSQPSVPSNIRDTLESHEVFRGCAVKSGAFQSWLFFGGKEAYVADLILILGLRDGRHSAVVVEGASGGETQLPSGFLPAKLWRQHHFDEGIDLDLASLRGVPHKMLLLAGLCATSWTLVDRAPILLLLQEVDEAPEARRQFEELAGALGISCAQNAISEPVAHFRREVRLAWVGAAKRRDTPSRLCS